MTTNPVALSIQRHARSAMTESMTIDERMGVYRVMINALMAEYTELRSQRDNKRGYARQASQDARAIANEERIA